MLMKKILKALSFIVLLPLAVALPVFLAQTINEDARVYAQSSNLQERVEKYKTKLSEQPAKTELDRLTLRCEVSQNALKNVNTKVASVKEKRVEVYKNLVTDLDELIVVLEQSSVDVTDLKAQVDVLKTMIETFTTDIETYRQVVEDASELDCATDPLALKASIQEGRKNLSTLVTQMTEIKAHINNLVKPSLAKIKADLQAQQAESQAAPTEEVVTDGTQ